MKAGLMYRMIVLGLVVFSLSCQKSSDADTGSGYFVKFKKNGSWVNYTQAAGEYGPDLLNPSKTNLGITGASNNQNESFDITIQVDGNNIPTGTYYSDNYDDYYVLVSYNTGFAGTNDLVFFENYTAPAREPSKYTITITSITATDIAGSFTGNYLYNLTPGRGPEDIINITEGSFRVKRIR